MESVLVFRNEVSETFPYQVYPNVSCSNSNTACDEEAGYLLDITTGVLSKEQCREVCLASADCKLLHLLRSPQFSPPRGLPHRLGVLRLPLGEQILPDLWRGQLGNY